MPSSRGPSDRARPSSGHEILFSLAYRGRPRLGGGRRPPSRARLTVEQLEDRALLSGAASPLGVAADFNVFVLGAITQSSSDAQGRVAAGGDVRLTGYGVGDGLPNSAGQRDDLVVGGNLTYDQGQVPGGNIVTGGTATLTGVGLPNGTSRQGSPVEFAAAARQLTGLSAAWAALAPNGTVSTAYGTVTLTGTDAALDVFDVAGSQLAAANGLTITAPAGATVLVNVSGADGHLQNLGITLSGTDRQHVLFNFADATALTLGGISIQGSVLAPGVAVTFNNGNLEGTLIAASLSGNGEFHNFPPQVQIDAPVSPTPAPATATLSGSVFLDVNADSVRQPGEAGVGGVPLTLLDQSGRVLATAASAADGSYSFGGLAVGGYTVREAPPAGYKTSTATSLAVSLPANGLTGQDFGLTAVSQPPTDQPPVVQPPVGQPLAHGQTATIGFWQGPNGQALINSFGTTAGGLTLAGWLARTFPHLYGPGGMHDLTGRSNADVAALFTTLFSAHGPKVEAQILATALAVFTTTNSLDAGSASRALAVKYGFLLNDGGTGAALWDVGSNCQAFGVAPDTSLPVLTLLRQTDGQVVKGALFGGDATLTDQANTVFSAVNEGGDIPASQAAGGSSSSSSQQADTPSAGAASSNATGLVQLTQSVLSSRSVARTGKAHKKHARRGGH